MQLHSPTARARVRSSARRHPFSTINTVQVEQQTNRWVGKRIVADARTVTATLVAVAASSSQKLATATRRLHHLNLDPPPGMEALRKTASSQGKMSSSSSGGQGLVALLVMIVVICFILAYYCWGACCRAFCPQRASSLDLDPESQFSEFGGLGQPTIILLPYGRMVVVDSRVFSQLQAESGLDLNELGRQISNDHEASAAEAISSTPDSEAKECLSPLTFPPPPAYDSIFGPDDMPPSYDEILRRNRAVSESTDCEDLRESSV